MSKNTLSRWQQFYLDDPSLQTIPPSACANQAAQIFSANNSRIVLDLGCGAGRDTFSLPKSSMQVIGLDAARSGLMLAQKRHSTPQYKLSWVESDSRLLPFSDSIFDGVYCFGLLHEFVGDSAKNDAARTIREIQRVLKASGVAIIAASAGDPEKGLPHVQNFSESMFDAVTAKFHCVEKKMYDDLGCTGRTDYKVWFGHFTRK